MRDTVHTKGLLDLTKGNILVIQTYHIYIYMEYSVIYYFTYLSNTLQWHFVLVSGLDSDHLLHTGLCEYQFMLNEIQEIVNSSIFEYTP